MAASAALKLLGESKMGQVSYFVLAYIACMVPAMALGLAMMPALVVVVAVLGLVVWARWFHLVQSAMRHYAEQVPPVRN